MSELRKAAQVERIASDLLVDFYVCTNPLTKQDRFKYLQKLLSFVARTMIAIDKEKTISFLKQLISMLK